MNTLKNFESLSASEGIAALISAAAEKNVLKKAVFSKPTDPSVTKMTATLRRIGKRTVLQLEYFMRDNKAIHKNTDLGDNLAEILAQTANEFLQINLITTAGDCELRSSKSGKQTLIGGAKLYRSIFGEEHEKVSVMGNDRKKERILSGSEPFLRLLGVSDENGRVYDKKRSKFNQINRFLELTRDVCEHLPKGEISICDLCCGKSYLSFAVYHYFANILGYKVKMFGADLKSDVIEYCNKVARELRFDGLEFYCTDIRKFEPEAKPDLVISLHACDTATDIVLESAVRWGAKVILSTPCCHHELNHTLNCPALSFIAEYSMLRQKFCDAATDALRLKYLESEGYSCEALELIDPEETPKNVMLRAVAKKNFSRSSASAKEALDEYRAAKSFLLGTPNK